jgi:AraC family transcriptional regulator of adaptative response/methylated-DNA-[protein]-cysteine methyltransferase
MECDEMIGVDSRSALTEQVMWQAVCVRDAQYDGAFVYAVSSTGIYCRPGCPSRRPARERVAYFATPAAAEQAGYRPCLRCQPHEPHAPGPALVERVRQYIQANATEQLTLDHLAARFHVSPYHLQRLFKRNTGVSPREYAASVRLVVLKTQLKEGQRVVVAQNEAGYGSSSRLYEQAGAQLGMTPADYRRGGLGAEIRYCLAPTALGRLLVAATQRGVCMVCLGDDDPALLSALRAEYPQATLTPQLSSPDAWTQAILRYVEGQQRQIDLPCDVPATAFQQRVWQALRQIPYGVTRTYNELAQALGAPGAARAVGHACATNPVALIIPCHRVVRADGGLGGYRWGVERKRRLLAQERQLSLEEAA